MKILVLNCGSSSLKYQIIEMNTEKTLVEGICDRIGMENSTITFKNSDDKITKELRFSNHKDAITEVLSLIKDEKIGIIKDLSEIDAIGHRVVHGGENFRNSIVVTKEVLNEIKSLARLAPLHNPANAMGIEICMELIKDKPNIAVFDTAFHSTLSPEAFLYAIPYEDYEEFKIRKYGFHGISYMYISQEVEKLIGKNKKIIVCHLGNGASVCAIKDGKSIATSMGLTPLEGLMMGTRCGDIDPSCVFQIMKDRNLTVSEVEERLNKKSGMLGISGMSSDSRDIEKAASEGKERAILTENIYSYKIKKYIGAYSALMGGLDALVFTAGIGENAFRIREKVCEGLEYLGIEFNIDENNTRKSGIQELSKANSNIKVFKIPTQEEYMIAKEAKAILGK
ncbi:MAG: acetate kinase [Fusobacteriaceae bacterium]|nr:acetate kinase [Fusobacteriaceae bacterium]MBN2837251.1 acetate kinase [Fusobacteriaceae bacterium]